MDIRVPADDNPLLSLIVLDSAGYFAGCRNIFSQIELVNYIVQILKDLWRGDVK